MLGGRVMTRAVYTRVSRYFIWITYQCSIDIITSRSLMFLNSSNIWNLNLSVSYFSISTLSSTLLLTNLYASPTWLLNLYCLKNKWEGNLLIRRFHGDSESLLMHLRVIMVVEITAPSLRVVPLKVRLLLRKYSLGYTFKEFPIFSVEIRLVQSFWRPLLFTRKSFVEHLLID